MSATYTATAICPECRQAVASLAGRSYRYEDHNRLSLRRVRGIRMAEPCPGSGTYIGAHTRLN